MNNLESESTEKLQYLFAKTETGRALIGLARCNFGKGFRFKCKVTEDVKRCFPLTKTNTVMGMPLRFYEPSIKSP